MEPIFVAVIGLISSVFVTAISIYGQKKLGIGTQQTQLISTLKDVASGQDLRIDQLVEEAGLKDSRIVELEKKVKELEQTVIQQAKDLARCLGKL